MTAGLGGERIDGTKPYQYGDPVSELDLHARCTTRWRGMDCREGVRGQGQGSGGKQIVRTPIKFDEHDFELHLHEGVTSCSTVVLLDMSGSMMRYGRFLAAKKVAMAMQALVRGRFPQDTHRLRRLLFRRGPHPRNRPAAGDAQAGDDLRLSGAAESADRSDSTRPRSTSPTCTWACNWPGESSGSGRARTSRFLSSPTASPPRMLRAISFT